MPFYRYLRGLATQRAGLPRPQRRDLDLVRPLAHAQSEYSTWRRLTDDLGSTPDRASAQRPVFHPLRVASVERLTSRQHARHLRRARADLAHEYRYVQGQHITLRAVVDGATYAAATRSCAPVSDGTLRVAVKQIEGGVFSTYVNSALQPGDILDVMSPTGTVPHRTRRGRAPALRRGRGRVGHHPGAVDHRHHARGRAGQHVHAGLRQPDARASTMFLAELDALRRGVRPAAGAPRAVPQTPRRGPRGRVTLALAARAPCRPTGGRLVPVRPAGLVDSPPTTCLDGSPLAHTEVFHTEPAHAAGQRLESQVTVALDGVESTFQLRSAGDTILDAALQQGLERRTHARAEPAAPAARRCCSARP